MNESAENDLEPFYEPLGLYIRPCARLNISLTLPPLKQPGQSISNWDLMEKIKKAIVPVQLSSIRVTLSTMEMVRFEAELPNRKMLHKVIKALEGYSLKVVGFFESLKVRASEAKSTFPTRHDWDEFFRTAKGMNELKAGERPDTIYLAKIPTNWFKDTNKKDSILPSEKLLKETFEQFGRVRCVDIPSCDPYRKQMPSSISGIQVSGFSFGQEIYFEAYVQFMEYISFMRAMNALRNMNLVKKMPDGRLCEASIKVDFDRTKHLSAKTIEMRLEERQRIMNNELRVKNTTESKRRAAEKLAKNNVEKEDDSTRQHGRRLQKAEESNSRLKPEQDEKTIRHSKTKADSVKSGNQVKEKAKPEKSKETTITQENGADGGDQVKLEAKLRQTLLQEQERRLRERIEAKMLLRLAEVNELNSSSNCINEDGQKNETRAHSSHKHRKRKHDS